MRPHFSICVVLLLSACRDDGEVLYAEAKQEYTELVTDHVRPSDFRYQNVLDTLAKVKSTSKAHDKALDLMHSIHGARAPAVTTPLAVGPSKNGIDPQLLSKQNECAELASQLGRIDGTEHDKLAMRLTECRRELSKMSDR